MSSAVASWLPMRLGAFKLLDDDLMPSLLASSVLAAHDLQSIHKGSQRGWRFLIAVGGSFWADIRQVEN